MKRYLKYKDSGIEGLDDVPSHWVYNYFKRFVFFQEGPGLRTWQFKESGIKVICVTNITEKGIDFSNFTKYISDEDYLENYKHFTVKKGDLLLASSGASWGKLAEFSSDEVVILNTSTIRLNSKRNKINRGFLKWLLNSNYINNQLAILITGSCQPNFGPTHLNKLEISIPESGEEQLSIVQFLDHKTGQIDRFIANRQKQIELLKEQLHFKINQAITKGINSRIRFKKTDIKYVPEIPEHWDIRKFKSLTSILTCGVAATPEYVDESEGVAFLSAQNCRPFAMDLRKYNYIKPSLHKQLTRYKKPQKGDVLVTRVGAGIGQACIIDTDLEFSVYVSLTHIRPNKEILSEYIVYFFNTEYCCQLNHEGTVVAGGQGNLNVKNVERYRILLPPVEEQKEIIAYLDNYRVEMDNLITKYQKQIDLMQEYRTALISQAVTGKIDVRDWKPKEKISKN